MKTLPALLDSHYSAGTTTLADLLKITRKDGTVYAFTSAADDVTISGQVYTSAQGLNISSIEVSAGFAVDNLELTTLDDGSVFTKIEVLSGVWRNADFTISRYNWRTPADGVEVRMVGTVGEVHLHRGYVTAELRGLQQYLQQPVGSVSSKTCRARLGDTRCTKDLTAFTFTGEITSVTNNQVFADTRVVTAGDDYWADVSTLLLFDGAAGSTTFTDSAPTPQTCTAAGTAVLSATQAHAGGTSLYISAVGANSANLDTTAGLHDFGTGDFTVEFLFYPTAVSNRAIFAIGKTGATPGGADTLFYIKADTSTRALEVGFYNPGGSWAGGITTASSAYTMNAWNHIAVVRVAGVVSVYVNGVKFGALAYVTANYTSIMKVMVGCWQTDAHPGAYYDGVRVTKAARYTAAFSSSVYASAWITGPNLTTFYGFDSDYFAEGLLTFDTGALAGQTHKVKSFAEGVFGQFTLSLPAVTAPAIGDAFTVIAGCQKRLTDCSTKFSNVLNFQGEPHLPGIDEILK